MRTVKQPNLPIEQVFKKVRVLVNEATDTKQTPWESSSLTEDFTFFSNANVNNGAPLADALPVRVSVAELGSRPVQTAYEAVIAEDTVEYYEEFVRLYPADPRCDHIRRLLGRRQQMVAWQVATHSNSQDAYQNFARRFGNTDLGFAARRLQERPRVINIAFPRKGEGKFGDGRFGTRIDFGRLNNNNNNRQQVIDFRNAGGRQNGLQQNGLNNRVQQNGLNNAVNNVANRVQQQQQQNVVNNAVNNNNNNNNQNRVQQQQLNQQALQNQQRQANLQQQQQNQQLQQQQQQRLQVQQQQQRLQVQQQQQRLQVQQQQQRLQVQQQQRLQVQQQQQIQRQPQVIQRAPQVQQVQRQNFQVQRQSFAPRQSFSGGGGGGGGRRR
jgi:hypothetical protein